MHQSDKNSGAIESSFLSLLLQNSGAMNHLVLFFACTRPGVKDYSILFDKASRHKDCTFK